jgi:hypothetical protein
MIYLNNGYGFLSLLPHSGTSAGSGMSQLKSVIEPFNEINQMFLNILRAFHSQQLKYFFPREILLGTMSMLLISSCEFL